MVPICLGILAFRAPSNGTRRICTDLCRPYAHHCPCLRRFFVYKQVFIKASVYESQGPARDVAPESLDGNALKSCIAQFSKLCICSSFPRRLPHLNYFKSGRVPSRGLVIIIIVTA